jgi:tetratricopeptide (TPR) repeat protein/mono/diheme cytochrome c family protein
MRRYELSCALAAFTVVTIAAACSRTTERADTAATRAVTFNEDIAPILFGNCASCHRPIDPPSPTARQAPPSPKLGRQSASREGGAGAPDDPLCVAGAPFSVLDYGSVRRYARAISSAVQRRAMPPWLPEPGHGEFAGERRLRDDQIALIAKWVESDAPEGDPSRAPTPPSFSGGWQLGTPDLVLTLPEAYELQAGSAQGKPGSRDVFRNFVIPVPITTTRYVRAVEFRADRPQVLHHADVALDLGRVSRALDRAEPGPGFAAMDGAQVYNVYGWSPGKVPVMEPAANAWTLQPGTDIVLLLHMIAGSEGEAVQPSIGLFFSDTPPTRTPVSVKLEAHGIAIPAGEPNYVVEDSYVLPVDVDAVSIYPHAHYLGKEMRGTATLPDGSQKDLLWIRQWDFRWQDRYRYRSPVFLPRGTRLSMRFTYDNSASNPNNRHNPPQRVRSGPRSTDEMGHLWIEVVPRRPEDAAVLNADFVRRQLLAAIAKAELDVQLEPNVAGARTMLAAAYLQVGRVADARAQLEEALRLDPRHAEARSNLGVVLQAQGYLAEGMKHLRTAVQLKPKDDSVRFNLGGGLLTVGQPDDAIREFRTAIALNPENADAHFNLGVLLGPRNQLDDAIAHLQRAVEINPLNADAYHNLAVAYGLQRQMDEAIASAQTAVRLKPDSAPAREMLRQLLAARNR